MSMLQRSAIRRITLRRMNSEKCAFLVLIFAVILLILHVYWNYDERVQLTALVDKGYQYPVKVKVRPEDRKKTIREVHYTKRPDKSVSLSLPPHPTKHKHDRENVSNQPPTPKPYTPSSQVNVNGHEADVVSPTTTIRNVQHVIPDVLQPITRNPLININDIVYPTKRRRSKNNGTDASLNEAIGSVGRVSQTVSPRDVFKSVEVTKTTLGLHVSENKKDVDLSFGKSTPEPRRAPQKLTSTSRHQVIASERATNDSNSREEVAIIVKNDLDLDSDSLLLMDVSYPHLSDPYKGHWVVADGDLTHRTKLYNAAISQIRHKILKKRGFKSWQSINSSSLEVLWGSFDDFHEKLSKRPEVLTVYLPWLHNTHSKTWSSLQDKSNIYVQEYYTWVATQPLCMWIETPGLTRARWDAVYNRTCNQDFNAMQKPVSLEVVYLHGKPINKNHYWPNDGDFYPHYFYTDVPKHVYYLHLFEDTVVTPPGDAISGRLKLVPYTCAHDINTNVPNGFENTPIYKEVFILTQFWGNQFFHRMIEMLPRMMPYLEFLQQNKEIMISIPGEDSALRDFLKILGISAERTVIGTVRAKVAYMPRGTPCGFALVHETQLFSQIMRRHIQTNMSPKKRNKIMMIRRTGLRHFRYDDYIQKALRELADEYKLGFVVFPDNPTPPLPDTMKMFYEAVVVVAPHGAALSNLIFSKPGTLVIEGVCNPPHVNMCFQRVAHVLGHRYHGVPSRTGCENEVHIDPAVIDFITRKYLEIFINEFNRP